MAKFSHGLSSARTSPVPESLRNSRVSITQETMSRPGSRADRPTSATSQLSQGPIIKYKRFTKDSLSVLELKQKVERERLKKKRHNMEGRLVGGQLKFDDDDDDLANMERDPALVEGNALPEEQYGECPPGLYGRPIEEIDQFIKNKTFVVINTRLRKRYIYRFAASSALWLFPPWNPLRRLILFLVTTQWFDYLIMLAILVNCIFLTQTNSPEWIEYIFLGIYSFESLLKIIARGFILDKHTYLRDGWNWLDFLVILLGYFTIILTVFNFGDLGGFASGLRTLRVLRALKTISVFPGLKTIVNALLRSMRMIAEVLTLILFCMMVFALFGLQIYMGVLHNKCVLIVDYNELTNISYATQFYEQHIRNKSNWETYDDGSYRMCGNVTGAGGCSAGYLCLKDIGANPNDGYTSFDHFGWAMLSSFQLITLDFWEDLYNMIIRTSGPWNILFFILIVFFGSYYLVNLMLAVVTMSYEEEALNDGKWVAYMKFYAKRQEENKDKDKLDSKKDSENNDTDKVPTVSEKVDEKEKNNVKKPKKGKLSKVGPVKQDSVQSNDTAISSSHGSLQSPRATEARKKLDKRTSDLDKNSTPVDSGMGSTKDVNEEAEGEKETNEKRRSMPYRPSLAELAVIMAQEEDEDDESTNDDIGAVIVIDDETGDVLTDRNCRCCAKCCCRFNNWLRFQNKLHVFTTDPLVEMFIILCILLNTAAMGVEYDGISTELENALEYANYVFTVIFTIEAILKILSQSVSYFRNKWNDFDFFLVVFSWIDIVLTASKLLDEIPGMSAFRILRLFRVFRLAQSWDTMRMLLSIIFSTLGSLGNLTFVLFIFVYIFAVIGLQLFSSTYTPENFAPDPVPRWNFTTFGHSLLMMFRVLCGEWIEPLWDCMRASSEICMLVFLPTLFIGNFMVLNLFLALLLNSFATDSLAKRKKESKAPNKFLLAITRLLVLCRCKKAASVEPESETKEEVKDGPKDVAETDGIEMNHVAVIPLDDSPSNGNLTNSKNKKNAQKQSEISADTTNGSPVADTIPDVKFKDGEKRPKSAKSKKSDDSESSELVVYDCFPEFFVTKLKCSCIPRCEQSRSYPGWYKFRMLMVQIVDHKVFEGIVLFLIGASSFSLAWEDIYMNYDPIRVAVLYYSNIIFCTLFTLEMLLKWFAYGFKRYFSTFWTILDFFIVVVSIASLIAESTGGADISSLRALRTLRAFRPLRAISRWQGMKIVVNALMFAIPAIINVVLVCFIFWLIFSILGVQLFKGLFYKCLDDAGEKLDHLIVPNKTECLRLNYTWKNSYVTFDNIGIGFVALLQVATFEGWMEVMVDAVDSRSAKDLQPYQEANMWAYLFFIVFIVVGAFFTLNLFIGVIIDNFNMLKKKYDGTYLDMFLTSSQRNYYNTLKKLGNKKPQKTIKRPKNKLQAFFFDIAMSTKFELAIVILIFLNMVAMAVEHYKQAQNIRDALEIINVIFTTIFALEALVKIVGMRWHYFRRMWNVFDFVIVILSILELSAGAIIADLLQDVFITPTLLRVVRVFRIGRVLRLVRAAKGIRKLLFALIISVPALFNIGALLFLFIFIYAILGMSLFGRIKHSDNLDDQVNFETFERSVLVLFRLATSAGWNDVLDPMFAQEPDCNSTHWMNPYGVMEAVPGGDCGNPFLAVIYMMTFVFLTSLLIINVYVAIILENFNQAHQQEEVGVTEDDFEMFYMVWERYDPHASQFIKYETLSDFVADLDEPLGIPKPNEIALVSFDLPIVKGEKVHCLDILMGLTKYRLGDVEMTQEFQTIKQQMEDKFREAFPTRVKTEVISSTIQRKKEDVAARTLQRAWRRHQTQKGMKNLARQASESRRSKSPRQSTSSSRTLQVPKTSRA